MRYFLPGVSFQVRKNEQSGYFIAGSSEWYAWMIIILQVIAYLYITEVV